MIKKMMLSSSKSFIKLSFFSFLAFLFSHHQTVLGSFFPSGKKASTTTTDNEKEGETQSLCRGYLTIRHIDAGGIGYKNGYSSATGLIFPIVNEDKWIWPFIDLRFHEFNNNTQAGNVGGGVRFASSRTNKVFGANLYYDYRNTRHNSHYYHYNQIGVGFEMLSKRVDLRINGYFPFNKHTISRCFFDDFTDGFFISRKRTEVSLMGVNAELGLLIKKLNSATFYTAFGPYYYGGSVCRHVIGGEFRLNMTLKKYLFVEGRVSHDNVFRTKVQGVVGLTFPLGCTSVSCAGKEECEFPGGILSKPAHRHEIIVLDKNCRWKWNF
jgi:hypothetical protein